MTSSNTADYTYPYSESMYAFLAFSGRGGHRYALSRRPDPTAATTASIAQLPIVTSVGKGGIYGRTKNHAPNCSLIRKPDTYTHYFYSLAEFAGSQPEITPETNSLENKYHLDPWGDNGALCRSCGGYATLPLTNEQKDAEEELGRFIQKYELSANDWGSMVEKLTQAFSRL